EAEAVADAEISAPRGRCGKKFAVMKWPDKAVSGVDGRQSHARKLRRQLRKRQPQLRQPDRRSRRWWRRPVSARLRHRPRGQRQQQDDGGRAPPPPLLLYTTSS